VAAQVDDGREVHVAGFEQRVRSEMNARADKVSGLYAECRALFLLA